MNRKAITWISGVLALFCLAHSESVPAATFSFTPSAVQGGGGMTIITEHPDIPGLMVSGGDNSGIHISEDYGASWEARNLGFEDTAYVSIAAITFAPGSNAAFAAVGNRKTGGLFWTSDISDTKKKWKPLTDSLGNIAPVRFSGQHNENDLGRPWIYESREARSTGNLLVYQADCFEATFAWCLFAGTYDQGVYVWWRDGDGVHFDHLAFDDTAAERQIRSLALDTEHNVLYAGTFKRGVQRLPLALVADAPGLDLGEPIRRICNLVNPTADELLLREDSLYIAAGPAGVYRAGRSGTSFSCVTPPIKQASCPGEARCAGPYWRSLAIGEVDGQAELYIGSIEPYDASTVLGDDTLDEPNGSIACPDAVNVDYDTVLASELASDPFGGLLAPWRSLMVPESTNPCDPGVLGVAESWWRAESNSFTQTKRRAVSTHPGRDNFNNAALHLTEDDLGKRYLFSAGSAGIHRIELTDASAEWVPTVNGIQGTQGLFVRTLPDDASEPEKIWYGMRDYFGLQYSTASASAGAWSTPRTPGLPASSKKYVDEMTAIERDADDPEYVYFGTLDTNVGGVAAAFLQRCNDSAIVYEDNVLLDDCQTLASRELLCEGDWQIGGLASATVPDGLSGEKEILFAAVIPQRKGDDGGCPGLYKLEDGEWEKHPDSAPALVRDEADYGVSIEWFGDSEPVYLYNRETGLHAFSSDVVGLVTYEEIQVDRDSDGVKDSLNAHRRFSGFMVASAEDSRLYVSVDDALYAVPITPGYETAEELTFAAVETFGPIDRSGPQELFVAIPTGATNAANVCVADFVLSTVDCFADGNDEYRNGALFPTSIEALRTIDGKRRLAVSVLTGGFFIGTEVIEE